MDNELKSIMDNLHLAEHWEERRHKYEGKMNAAMILRNIYIEKASEDGYRQKEISNAIGLSESRIKKIIGELKK